MSGIRMLPALAAVAAGLTLLAGPLGAQRVEAPDRRATETARAMAARGADPGSIAKEMASRFRQSAGQTAAILRSLRVRVDATGRTLARTYRLGGEETVAVLVGGGFEAREVVAGSARLGVGTPDVARGLRSGGVPTRDLVRAFRASGRPVADAVAGLRHVEVPVRQAADLVSESYGSFEPTRMRAVIREAGYPVGAPTITRYWIRDHRRLGSNATIENVGVVDPERVVGPGVPTDGRVTIEGSGLDAPGTTVTIEHAGGVTGGEIEAARPDEIEVGFRDFGSGDLVVETPGGRVSVPVRALSYADRTAAQLFDPEPTVVFAGSEARVAWGFTGVQTASASFTGDDTPDLVVTGSGQAPAVTLSGSGSLDLTAEFVVDVPTSITGGIVPMIACWTCGDFQVDKSVCGQLTLDCILANVAAAASSLFECADLRNWREDRRPGPPIPVQGQGVSSLTYRAHVNVGPEGRLLPVGMPASYTGGVWNTLPGPPTQASFAHADMWWDTVVIPAIRATGEAFADQVATRLESWHTYLPGMLPGATLTGLWVQPGGALRFTFEH